MVNARRFLKLLVLVAFIANGALAGTLKKKDGQSVSGEIKGTLVFKSLIRTDVGGGGYGLIYYTLAGNEVDSITEEGVRWKEGKSAFRHMLVQKKEPPNDVEVLTALKDKEFPPMGYMVEYGASNWQGQPGVPDVNPIPVRLLGELRYEEGKAKIIPSLDVETPKGIVKVPVEDIVAVVEKQSMKKGEPITSNAELEKQTIKKSEPSTSSAEGRALLTTVVEALGGTEKVKSVRSLRQKITLLVTADFKVAMERVVVFPDRFWQKATLPKGEVITAVSPATAFKRGLMGDGDLSASEKAGLLAGLMIEPLFIVQHADDPKFTFAAAGSGKVGDIEARVLDVNADGVQVRWFVDPKTGRILRAIVGRTDVVDFAEWKLVGGISLPFKQTFLQVGQTLEYQEIEINPSVDPKLFEKPEAKPAGETK